MTNGEKIVNTFHGKVSKNDGVVYFSTDGWIHAYAEEWWNSEYKESTTKNDLEIQKAIEIIKADSLAPYSVDEILSARDLAVEALKQMITLEVDAVSRKALLNATVNKNSIWNKITDSKGENLETIISNLPSVTPQEPRWIPVSEKLPNDRDWYLGIFKEPDTGWINPLPFICDYVGRETKATTKEYWILRGLTDRDERITDYYFNLECVAWMPLPEPYKAESEVEE